MNKDQVVSKLQEAAIKSSISRLKSFCKVEPVAKEEANEAVDGAKYRDMALILLAGPEIHMMLKIFFNSNMQKEVIEATYGPIDDEKMVSKYSIDTLKEILNLIIGHLKQLLDKSGLHCEISLPIALRGYDELFFRDQIDKESEAWTWSVDFGGEKLLFSGILKLNFDRDIEFEYVEEGGSFELL